MNKRYPLVLLALCLLSIAPSRGGGYHPTIEPQNSDGESVTVVEEQQSAYVQPVPATPPAASSATALFVEKLWYDPASVGVAGHCPLAFAGYSLLAGSSWPVPASTGIGKTFSAEHPAIDIEASKGSQVLAMQAGVVVWAGPSIWNSSRMVIIGHAGGWLEIHGHVEDITVSCSQYVARGQQIATVGTTGSYDDYPHDHLSIRHYNWPYDPFLFIGNE